MSSRVILCLVMVVGISSASIQTEFESCVNKGLGEEFLVCDIDNVLSNKTNDKLTSLLKDMQTRIPCKCKNGCTRSNGNDKYLGVMLVTDSAKLEANGKALNETANSMYKTLELGNAECHNGLFIVYIKDKQQLATYRGPTSFMLLKQSEMSKLHNLAAHQGEDASAMQYLLNNYDNVAMRSDIQRAESWTPMIGLWLALIIMMLILALLLALFLAKFCCCCARSSKEEDTYRVTAVPTYTTIQPLFIAPPPPPLHDQIYSTPYSGTPIPPPHVGVSRMDTYRGSMHSATLSQSATPVSTHKHRIRPVPQGVPLGVPRGTTPTGTPQARSAYEGHLDDTMIMGTESMGHFQRNSTSSMPQATPRRTSQELYGVQRALGGNGDNDLAFLDPNRKQEIQTRTDFIY